MHLRALWGSGIIHVAHDALSVGELVAQASPDVHFCYAGTYQPDGPEAHQERR